MPDRKDLERALLATLREPLPVDDPDVFAPDVENLDRDLLLRSAERFGTPQYLLDVDALRTRAAGFLRTMRAHLPSAEACYAFKCNDLPALVSSLRDEGLHADVAGLFELQLALRLGFRRILFSGPGKSADELRLALEHADRVVVNLDNLDEIDRLAAIVREAGGRQTLEVGLRVNTATGSSGTWWKFGFELDELPEAIRRLDAVPGLAWTGMHFHGSWNKTPEGYVRQIARIGGWMREHVPPERLAGLRFFDIGGGFYPERQAILSKAEDAGVLADTVGTREGDRAAAFDALGIDPNAFRITPVEPLDTFARNIAAALAEHVLPVCPAVTVYAEPGRFLATFATTILLRVVAVKRHGVIVDGGINLLGDYKLAEYSFAPVVNLSRPSTAFRRRVICGSLCDPADLWGYGHYGDDLRVGDVLAVLHQGAYTFSGAWRFIKSIPPYVAASGGELELARVEETFETRYAGCRM